MKIIRFEYNDYKVYNPIKGDVIIDDDDCNDESPSLIAYWHSACFPESTINNKEFNERWKQYIIDIDDMPDSDYLEIFLREYENPEWIVYIIDSCGMGCGPSFDTIWLVVNKYTIVEEK